MQTTLQSAGFRSHRHKNSSSSPKHVCSPRCIHRQHRAPVLTTCSHITAASAASAGTTIKEEVTQNGSVHEGATSTQDADKVTEPFSWTARWWPIHDVVSLDPKIPMHVDLLGMSLVVWADTKGAWHCLEDKCPHRLAPLSEGRVEPQGLMCCYHGWTFDGNGSCTSIPQMALDAEAAACSSKRACVKSYPTMVAHGLLWVWPEARQTEAAQAAVKDLNDLMHADGYVTWSTRDLPVRYDTLLENAIDPS